MHVRVGEDQHAGTQAVVPAVASVAPLVDCVYHSDMTDPEYPFEASDVLAEALNAAWRDWIGDTGCMPATFEINGELLYADFTREPNFMISAVGWLRAKGWAITPVNPAVQARADYARGVISRNDLDAITNGAT